VPAGVLDAHFRDMDAKDGAGGGVGFASSTGVNHLELFKWKANVPHVQVVAARRTMADLAATVPSLGPSTLLSGGALSGSASGADLAVVAHFSSADELEAYQRSAERRSAIESIRPLLAEAPTTATFGNDVPAVLAERSGRSIAALGSGGAGEQMGQAEYEAAVELDPTLHAAHVRLTKLLLKSRPADSLRAARAAVALRPQVYAPSLLTPYSLQGQYRAGRRAHTPSRVAPPPWGAISCR
jgi:hypothetical protein